jgi:hypothetical protein
MALTMYGFSAHPNAFAVTKIDAPLDECSFMLNFSQPLTRNRWFFGLFNRWIGVTVGILVPVIHVGDTKGGFVIAMHRGEPYFIDIPRLWRTHERSARTLLGEPIEPLQMVAMFAMHFPIDAMTPDELREAFPNGM